ncbi:Os10g0548750 [Oryza sativa Japonica Group]|uniref:Os10g0548750 protein n=1 Tax=Oryza sativa subsp. japonica TaxID=39947 RepID=A0A0P0XX75_ORYSJ|nr:hypothetical protein EE612_052625 [Oryza sativa]BAT11932.1 Os10g0548750 [Oryza sativa Japonica Group]
MSNGFWFYWQRSRLYKGFDHAPHMIHTIRALPSAKLCTLQAKKHQLLSLHKRPVSSRSVNKQLQLTLIKCNLHLPCNA